MRTLSKICFTGVFMAAIVAASVRTAQADIIVSFSVDNTGTENVLLTSADNVATAMGTVNSGNFDVFFTSTGGTLDADGSGQATIAAGSTNDPFLNVSFELENDETFTAAVFNINVLPTFDPKDEDGFVRFTITGINLTGGTFSEQYEVTPNGQNFFRIDAINGQLMQSITLDAVDPVVFDNLKQVRLGGFGTDVPDVQEVPEPTSMFLLGTGLFGLAAKVRGRRKK